jgi:iron-sulfur cluster repair protein YtfE (RIC family)
MTEPPDPALALDLRDGLPPELLRLLERWPREMWDETARMVDLAAFWLQRHAMFRRLSAQSAQAVEALRLGEAEPEAFRPRFARTAQRLLIDLDGHHRVEDGHYFPAFRRAAPELGHGFAVLDADHDAIHAAIDAFAADANALLQAADWRGPADAMADRLARFDAALSRHLDDEEDLVIPLILDRAAAGDPMG